MCSDPVYMLSSENDHVRATFQANASPQKLVSVCDIVFVYSQWETEHHTRYICHLISFKTM